MTATMNVSLPMAMRRFVEKRVRQRGYATSSEYFRELVRRDVEQAQLEHLRSLIQEGLESPIATGTWEDFKQRALAQSRKKSRT